MLAQQCEVCREVQHKYRCPQCRVLYCSVGCYKTHKETCQVDVEKQKDTAVLADQEPHYKPVTDFELREEESEDRVADDRLALLGGSPVLKNHLSNVHLKQLLTSLVNAHNPAQLLDDAMHEPIFSEFADTCLTIIDAQQHCS